MIPERWRLTHPAHVRIGDRTPAGRVADVDVSGSLELTVITTHDRTTFTRRHTPDGWLHVDTWPVTLHGWVDVGGHQLRPAVVSRDGMIYSPAGAGGWQTCPSDLARTYVHQYDADAFRPLVVPDGYRVVS